MNVSIVIPIYNPDKKILKKIDEALKKQKFSGKSEIIKVDKGLGLADSMNFGINKAKNEIIVTLHQDCVPVSNDWIEKLVEPLKEKDVVCSIGKVELPFDLWNSSDFISKILSVKEQRVWASFEKACAYKKKALIKAGLFDGYHYKTAGEDADMDIKLKKFGKCAFVDAKVYHYHYTNWKSRLKKEFQLSNGSGAIVRIYGIKSQNWWIGIIKSIPLLGWPVFLLSINPIKIGVLNSIIAVPLYLVINCIYSIGFWKGFLIGRQTV